LFHVSDLHCGAADAEALAWFAAEVATQRPDAVICTGDLTMRGTHREFAEAARWLGALPAPVSLEPGNHDMPYYWELLTRMRHPFARYGELTRAVHRDLAVEGVALVSLPTVAPAQWRLNWSKGRVDPGQLATAVEHLHDARGAGLLLVACHHPLVDADTEGKGSTRGGRAALAVLAAAGADVVLSGHVHDAFDMTIDAGGRPIRLIGAGTLSQRVRASAPSYNRLEWSAAGGLKVSVRSFGAG
jgi:3',5'-cyclic AMP phosphodiesterase CpdA